ncbi:hypothetical protein [Aquimarina longa]|uniref:hypothetical protein n=1 Tax=Aquimarina longa TaxID=1080221 RepID=UPI000783F1B6|nr:hypothetical protein [Aquimarina longa]
MANLCTNLFFATIKVAETTEKHETVYQTISTFLEDNLLIDNIDLDECFIEAHFQSKWSFPNVEMQQLAQQLKQNYPNECKDLYMRCLSYEFGCEYADFQIFENGKWQSKMN